MEDAGKLSSGQSEAKTAKVGPVLHCWKQERAEWSQGTTSSSLKMTASNELPRLSSGKAPHRELLYIMLQNPDSRPRLHQIEDFLEVSQVPRELPKPPPIAPKGQGTVDRT